MFENKKKDRWFYYAFDFQTKTGKTGKGSAVLTTKADKFPYHKALDSIATKDNHAVNIVWVDEVSEAMAGGISERLRKMHGSTGRIILIDSPINGSLT